MKKKIMKIGTLRCKLLGHKFIEMQWVPFRYTNTELEPWMKDGEYRQIPVDYCIRCGLKIKE